MPVVQSVLPYLNAMVIVLQRLAESIAHFFGISLDANSSAVGTTDIWEEMEQDAEDTSDAIAKLNKQLAGFDKLNNLTTSQKGSTDGLEDIIDLSDQIADAVSNYKEVWDKAYANIEDKATKIANKIQEIAKISVAPIKFGFTEFFNSTDLNSVKDSLLRLKESIADTFDSDVVHSMTSAVGGLMQGFSGLLGSVLELKTAFYVGLVNGISSAIKKMKQFNKTKISNIADQIKKIKDQMQNIADSFSKLSNVFKSEKFEKLAETLAKIGDVAIATAIEWVTGDLADLFDILTRPFTDNADTFVSILEKIRDIANMVLEPLGNLLDTLHGGEFTYENSWFHKFMTAIADRLSDKMEKKLKAIDFALGLVRDTLSKVQEGWESIKDKTAQLKLNILNSQFLQDCKDNWDSIKSKAVDLKQRIENSQLVQDAKALWDSIKDKAISLQQRIEDSAIVQKAKSMWDDFHSKTIDLKMKLATSWEDIKKDIKSLINKIIDFINENVIDNLNDALKITIPSNALTKYLNIDGWGGQIIKIGHIPSLKTGGFPNGEDGLFFANHNELVGQFSNGKTAVANNDQIVAGIEQGVYRAVTSALANGNGANVNITLEGDADGLFKVIKQQANNYQRRTGNPAFGY